MKAGRQTSELDCTFLNDFEKAKDDECKDRWQQAECGCSVEFGTRDGIENSRAKACWYDRKYCRPASS